MSTITFGEAYSEVVDGERIRTQMQRIREYCLGQDKWFTLHELSADLGYPESSISAQLRHLRKEQFGGYQVEKRRRVEGAGTWEYRVLEPEAKVMQENFFGEDKR